MIGKFKQQWQKRQEEEIDQDVTSLKAETNQNNEDNTRYGNIYEILSPQELEELAEKEKMEKIKVSEILQETYDELEKALKEGEEENNLEIEKSILKRTPKFSAKPTFLQRIKKYLPF